MDLNACRARALRIGVGITVLAIVLLISYSSVAFGDSVAYTWKFDKFAIGKDAIGSAQESYGVMMSDIIKLPDGSYRMYYGVSLIPPVSGATTAIKSAVSTDGINWTVESGYRLLGYGGSGDIPANEGSISGPRVVRLSNGTYRMYYQAATQGTMPPDFRVKSAISSNGTDWTREGTRVDINYPSGGANQFALAGHSYVIRFADNDYVILIGGNYGKSAMQPSDLVIGTSNDGLSFSNFSVLYTSGHDPFVVKLANGSGYRLFYGNLMERQRTAFSADGKNWPSANQTNETILLNGTGNEVTEASSEAPGDRSALELPGGEIILFVNWGNPSSNIALMRQQSTSTPTPTPTPTSTPAPTPGSTTAAPSNLSATGLSTSSIRVSWQDNSNNEWLFFIFRWDGAAWTPGFAQANATSYDDIGLLSGKTYYYMVGAYNDSGGAWANTLASATTLVDSAPVAPSNLSATALSSSSIRVSWQDNSNNEGLFIVFRWDGGAWTPGFAQTNATSYTDSGLQANKTYVYLVGAYNSLGGGWASGYTYATTLP